MGNSCIGASLINKNGLLQNFAEAVPNQFWKTGDDSQADSNEKGDPDSNPNKAPCTVSIPDHNNNCKREHSHNMKRFGEGVPSITSSVLQHKTANLRDLYTVGRRLGQGQFGTTYLCLEKETDKEYACKSIAKRKLLSIEDVEDVRREIQIMHHLSEHPNVVTIKGAYEDVASVHLVMELCAGGELFDRIIQRGHYSERKAAELTRTIVGVVEACHSLGVMHRDLKPENFLLSNGDEDSPLKATDFGLSVFFKPETKRPLPFGDACGRVRILAPWLLLCSLLVKEYAS
eukprot:Gb_10111 [translate_table: standard]